MNDKQREAFRRQMRKGLPENGEPVLHTILGIVALGAWAWVILHLLGLI